MADVKIETLDPQKHATAVRWPFLDLGVGEGFRAPVAKKNSLANLAQYYRKKTGRSFSVKTVTVKNKQYAYAHRVG